MNGWLVPLHTSSSKFRDSLESGRWWDCHQSKRISNSELWLWKHLKISGWERLSFKSSCTHSILFVRSSTWNSISRGIFPVERHTFSPWALWGHAFMCPGLTWRQSWAAKWQSWTMRIWREDLEARAASKLWFSVNRFPTFTQLWFTKTVYSTIP